MFTKITHITVFVLNQDKALDFYKKLGFLVHTDADFGEMRWLTLCLPGQKDVEIALLEAQTEAEKVLVGKQAGLKPLLTLETDNCQGDYERLQKESITFFEKPKQESWGISTAFQDLYGNYIYMCQPQ